MYLLIAQTGWADNFQTQQLESLDLQYHSLNHRQQELIQSMTHFIINHHPATFAFSFSQQFYNLSVSS